MRSNLLRLSVISLCVDWRHLMTTPSLTGMSEPTPPGSGPQEPTPPSYEPPASSPPPASPPGYSAPPPGGGYSAPPPIVGSVAPTGYASGDEKNWALIAHFGGAVGVLVSGLGGWIGPLIALVAKGNESPTVKAHALAALNFQGLWAVISLVSICLGTCLSWLFVPLVLFLVPLYPLIMGILAGVKANNGELPKYPLTMTLIK
jgi:uncharacterized Tic20 family protein